MFIYAALFLLLLLTGITLWDTHRPVNSGFATIPAAYSTAAVTHGLATGPYQVLLTGYSNPGNATAVYLWADTYTTSNFMIRANAPVDNATSIAWRAFLKRNE